MKLNRSKKGFTLVEIMIVVVIIGLLAAMAIPAFQKVRTNSLGKTMVNDARQIAGACQQILLENPTLTTFTITYSTTNGLLTSAAVTNGPAANDIQKYVAKISKGYSATTNLAYNGQVAAGVNAFQMAHAQLRPSDVGGPTAGAPGDLIGFDTEGKVIP